ncbi:MAG TPA: SUF system Fe-S cluster assembly regulator [Candidatus Acidoferrales bacterium]|nr:SUF system Fe-S cluster assembly regulator [Candidatus Acidoferrales bacterium]
MLKLSKKSDYALIALKHLAVNADKGSFSASDIAESYGISAPLMAKVLQKLARVGIVIARHGSSGGYMLARDARLITAFEAIDAIDGPLSLTSCVTHHGDCEQTKTCTVREPLRRVNNSILAMLNKVTISEMAHDAPASEVVELRG